MWLGAYLLEVYIPKPSTDLPREPMCHGEIPNHELSIATAAWMLLLGLSVQHNRCIMAVLWPSALNHLHVLIFLV